MLFFLSYDIEFTLKSHFSYEDFKLCHYISKVVMASGLKIL